MSSRRSSAIDPCLDSVEQRPVAGESPFRSRDETVLAFGTRALREHAPRPRSVLVVAVSVDFEVRRRGAAYVETVMADEPVELRPRDGRLCALDRIQARDTLQFLVRRPRVD